MNSDAMEMTKLDQDLTNMGVSTISGEITSPARSPDGSNPQTLDSTQKPTLACQILKTIPTMGAYFLPTLSIGIIGPCLLDLQHMTSTSTEQVTIVFTCRGILAIISCLLVGPILDLVNHQLLVAIALLCSAIFSATVPFSTSLITLLCTLGPPEFFGGVLGMGTHLIITSIWKEKSAPVLQAHNLVSIVGFLIGPLLCQPFLEDSETDVTTLYPTSADTQIAVVADNFMSHNNTIPAATDDYIIVRESRIKYVFWIVSSVGLILSAAMFAYYMIDECNIKHAKQEEEGDAEVKSTSYVVKMALLFFFFNIFLAGIEIGFPAMLTTFAVEYLHWSKSHGAYVTSVTYGGNVLMTLTAVILARYLRPNVILMGGLVMLNLSMFVFVLVIQIEPLILWACAAGVGLGVATLMPASYAWLNDMINLSGKLSSVYWCGYFVGVMSIPALVGFCFNQVHAMYFPYLMTGCSIIMMILFLSAVLVHRKHTIGSFTVRIVDPNVPDKCCP